ncbi:MAG TPA: glutathione peroxidase [Polyangiaceae bacterium LLY-WYZ-14_1]|nr:glutathione peroxidase [Polyangiaceae bacterium LLY-WYZ-14_1]
MSTAHDFSLRTIDGEDRNLGDYAGKALLVVNVASRCGYTPQYADLERLYRDHKDQGFEVLGVPSNQFGAQEPGTEAEIKQFCESRYQVTFPMFAKVDVNGPNATPLYAWLTRQETAPEGAGDIPWNFNKFVIGKDGRVVARFPHGTKPTDPAVVEAIGQALA